MSTNYKDIPGFPGYRVGDDGSVWTRKRRGASQVGDWRQMRASVGRDGLLQLILSVGGKGFCRKVGRLVLEAFDRAGGEGETAFNKNGDPRDNRLSNLRWRSAAERALSKRVAAGATAPGPVDQSRWAADMDAMRRAVAETVLEFREVPGYPGYRVGNDGSVWSRHAPRFVGGKLVAGLGDQWHRLELNPVASGHLHVMLYPNRDTKLVHRLVLEAFAGPAPAGAFGCHYPDPDPCNNHIANLRWDSPAANTADAMIHGTIKTGERHPNAKLTDSDLEAIKEMARGEVRNIDIARRFGVSVCTVKRVVSGRRRATNKRMTSV